MRVTSSMMTNKYARNLNRATAELDKRNERVYTKRKFTKGSEDPISAIKAYKLRREFRNTEMYESNIMHVESFLTEAETNLNKISSDVELTYTSYLKGITGTMGAEEREIIAKQLDNLQESILTSLNGKCGDQYVFGGASKDVKPFTVEGGKLCYKGYDLTSDDPAVLDALNRLKDEPVYIDLGLSMEFNGSDVVPDTVFNMSMSGLKFMGYGASGPDNIPNNLHALIGEMKDVLRSPDFSIDKIQPYIESYEKQKSNVLVNTTDIGSKTNYLSFLTERNEDYKINVNKKILDVEYVDQAEAITEFMDQQYAYNAALSMGTKILQNSFIDFMK